MSQFYTRNHISDALNGIYFRIFLNETTGNVLQMGDTLKMHALAKTLKEIAEHGVDIFYKGSIGTKVVEDNQRRGGILTKDDLLHYRCVAN